jgi:PilZ domain-containing protein
MSIHAVRRREPRVRLRTRAVLFVRLTDGATRQFEAITTDVSPHGVAVVTSAEVPVGSVVDFLGRGYGFRARARVQNSSSDGATGCYRLGLIYLGKTNPLVLWAGSGDVDGKAEDGAAHVEACKAVV